MNWNIWPIHRFQKVDLASQVGVEKFKRTANQQRNVQTGPKEKTKAISCAPWQKKMFSPWAVAVLAF
jgi:hypothetical protein